jgi:hypothetical protein
MYYGCKKEKPDKRDYKSVVCATKSDVFPDEYYIEMPSVKDQGIVNSCVAHSLATFMETAHKEDEDNISFSTGLIYGYRPLGYSQDEGMYPREGLKTLLKLGDVPRDKFNHNKEMPEIKQLVDKNLTELKPLADIYKITGYSRIYTEQEIKKCIYNNIPVPISIPVYNDLAYDKETNIVNLPDGECQGYHMVTIYGYNENGWIFQNSWGSHWAAAR